MADGLLAERIAAAIGSLIVVPQMLELAGVDPRFRGVTRGRALVAATERDAAALASVDLTFSGVQLRSLQHALDPVQSRC
jgi:hypothetical protein